MSTRESEAIEPVTSGRGPGRDRGGTSPRSSREHVHEGSSLAHAIVGACVLP